MKQFISDQLSESSHQTAWPVQSSVYQKLDGSAPEQEGKFLASALGAGGVGVVGGGEVKI